MNRQFTLPFPHLAIPERYLLWFWQANAGEYWQKKQWFYPFKNMFLKKHGLPDGVDLQIIEQRCWCGDGVFRGVNWKEGYGRPESAWESCLRCAGTGIYNIKYIVLQRWILGSHIFHQPLRDEFYQQPYNILIERFTFRETIRGLIKHESVSPQQGLRAMLRLLLRYERETWYAYHLTQWQEWKRRNIRGLQWKIRRVNQLACIRKRREDEIPF